MPCFAVSKRYIPRSHMHASEALKLFQQFSLPVETLDLVVQFSDFSGILIDLLMKGRHIDRAEGAAL